MKYTYEQPDYLDVNGARHLVQELKKYIQDIMNGKIDISQYATKDELSSAVSSIDLSGYALKGEIPSLDAYAKKTDLPSLDGYAKTTDIPSVEGLATKTYVDENIAKVATSGDIDLSNYVTKDTVYTKEQTNALIPSVPSKVSQLENDSNYLSSIPEEYVTDTELNAKGYLTEHQDLSAYALKTEIPTVPSLDGYATTEYVDNAIANVPSGGTVDLSDYYTKEETNALIPSTDGLATTEYVDNAVSNIPTTDLSNYYTKSETYSKTEVDTLVANSGGSSGGGASGITYAYDTEIATGDTWIDGKPIYMRVFHIDALTTKPNGISMKSYYEQPIFADQIVSVNTIWKKTTSNGDDYYDGNSILSPSTVATSSSYVGGNVNDFIIGRETWVKVNNFNKKSEPTFYITVGRGAGHYDYGCEVIMKYTKI